jgi:hypothetical protein
MSAAGAGEVSTMLTFAVAHIVVDQVARALAVQDSGWAIFAAVAAALAAFGTFVAAGATLVLAFYTRKSVQKTNDIIANENANFRVKNTIMLLNEFYQPVAFSLTMSTTPQAAVAVIFAFADSIREQSTETTLNTETSQKEVSHHAILAALQFIPGVTNVTDDAAARNNQEKTFVLYAFVAANYFMKAGRLLRQGVLDRPLLLEAYAKRFADLYESLTTVQAELELFGPEQIKKLCAFKDACVEWNHETAFVVS